jgi:hypothetical protein
LRLILPDWWERILLDAQVGERGNVFFAERHGGHYHDTAMGLAAPGGTVINRKHGCTLLEIGAEALELPTTVLEMRDKQLNPAISAAFRDRKCFLALHGDQGSPYALVALDRQASMVLWTVDVWAGGGLPRYSGIGFHWVGVLPQQARVLVLGACTDCLYIEAFAMKDGASLFRFSTAYGRQADE